MSFLLLFLTKPSLSNSTSPCILIFLFSFLSSSPPGGMSGAQLPTRLNRNREQKVHQNCHRKLQHKFFQKKKKNQFWNSMNTVLSLQMTTEYFQLCKLNRKRCFKACWCMTPTFSFIIAVFHFGMLFPTS